MLVNNIIGGGPVNPLDKFSILSDADLHKSADDASLHRFELEHLEMMHLNNPHKYTDEEREELAGVLQLVISLENEIHAEIQGREARRNRQWL